MKKEFGLNLKEVKSLSGLFSKLVSLKANQVNSIHRVDVYRFILNEAVKKYVKLPDTTSHTPYTVCEAVLTSAIDKTIAEKLAATPLRDGECVAYRVKVSSATGRSTYHVADVMPIFPGGENMVKSLAKKATKTDGFFAIGKKGSSGISVTIYQVTERNVNILDVNGLPQLKDGKTLTDVQKIAVKVSSMIRRYSSSETAFKAGIVAGLKKVV